MLSKNQIKFIRSLSQKKYRQESGHFKVEGIKGIQEFLNSEFELEILCTTDAIFDVQDSKIWHISDSDLKKISSLKNPNTALAVFHIPRNEVHNPEGLIVALDDLRDPGNMGTIIRLCDWFGVKELLCSLNTVDCYNPKVVQASMGSLSRVKVTYLDLPSYLKSTPLPVYGTFMEGENIYTAELAVEGVIVFGNEANGISDGVKQSINQALTIPQFGEQQKTESLNVANAAAITLSEFRRQAIEM